MDLCTFLVSEVNPGYKLTAEDLDQEVITEREHGICLSG